MFYIDNSKCKGCGLCVKACPQQAITLNKGTSTIKQELCMGCGTCREICNNNAIYEVEILTLSTATTGKVPSRPLEKREAKERTSLLNGLAALPLIVIEELLTFTEWWAYKKSKNEYRSEQMNREYGCRPCGGRHIEGLPPGVRPLGRRNGRHHCKHR